MRETLVIEGVDFDLLEKQRIALRNVLNDCDRLSVCGGASVKELRGLEAMLDEWSDQRSRVTPLSFRYAKNYTDAELLLVTDYYVEQHGEEGWQLALMNDKHTSGFDKKIEGIIGRAPGAKRPSADSAERRE